MRWVTTLCVLVLASALVGCTKVDQQVKRLGLAQRATTVGATVQTSQGVLSVFRFTQKRLMQSDFCGAGFSIQGVVISEGQSACDKMSALTWAGQTHGDQFILVGRINDPRITHVILSMDDGQKLEATIGDGVWYMLLPRSDQLPPIATVAGLDQGGTVVDSAAFR